jgi:hypothetical protein
MDVLTLFMQLLKSPWFYQSPNPLTLLSWAIMGFYGSTHLKDIQFRRFSQFFRWLNALFIAGIIVIIQDIFFLSITTIRWVPIYPQFATLDFWLCFPRDLSALALLFLMEFRFYGIFTLNMKTWLSFGVLWIYTSAIFFFTPTMGITNWTYAITEGMADSTVLLAFMLNFAVGKPFLFWIYTTLWDPLEDSSISVINPVT